MAIPSFSSTVVARAAAALYGAQLGNGTMSAVLDEANSTGGVEKLINSVYARDYAAMSNTDVATMVVANLGITGAGVANAVAYLKAKIDAAGAANEGAAIAAEVANFTALTGDATYGAAASAFNGRIAAAVAYAQQDGTVDRAFGAGATIALTMGQDFLSGTSGNDTIVARIFNNSNTLQSGDWVDGGAGADRLEADMGESQDFSVTPETTNVETFSVRAQSRASDSGDNNVANEDRVIVDAQRMAGVTRFDSTESRADLIIEDVRTSLRTKDITIGMIGTDAGNVDYSVYFDRLRADGTSTATLTIELMDTRAATSTDAAIAALPLKDSPYNGFSFKVNGETVTLKDAIPNSTDRSTFNGSQTYEDLLAAIRALLTKAGLTNITANLGPDFEARDTKTGQAATGKTIVLSGGSAGAVTLAPGNFIADDGVPADSGLHTVQSVATSSSTDLVTSTVVLSNVGRGSNGGDLVIGSMSVGETSSSGGIPRFEITVEERSSLGIIASTNNALKEVVVKNGDVKGNLLVQGFDGSTSIRAGSERDAGTGGAAPGASGQHGAYGFTDVRLIDMSAMTGTVSYDATITSASFAKYVQLSDTQGDPKGDNNSTDGKTTLQVADFEYSGGTSNDTIAVQIDDAVIASNSKVLVGREDFTFVVNGNGGNDAITVVIGEVDYGGTEDDDSSYLAGGTENWYEHQKANRNLTINGGDGNDTVRKPGSGDATINLGAGDDTVYTDNTGTLDSDTADSMNVGRAVWVFNTDDQVTPNDTQRDIDDIESDRNDNWYMYKSTLTVTFLGDGDDFGLVDALESISVPVPFNTATYRSSDLHINQAIKAAISGDPVLSKLLVAEDGPANSLVVRSLIDGEMLVDELRIDIVLPDVSKLTDSDAKKVAEVWRGQLAATAGAGVGSAAWDEVDAITDSADAADDLVAFMESNDDASYTFTWQGFIDNNQGYDAAFAVDEDGDDLTGANSTGTTTDNTIEGGTGRDVIVLSTTDDTDDGDDGSAAAEAADRLLDSNEVVRYTAAFGDDTIVNFEASLVDAYLTDGADQLSLTALGGFGSSGVLLITGGAADDVDVDDEDDGTIIINEVLDDDEFEDIDAAYVAELFGLNDLGTDDFDLDNDGDTAEDLTKETFVYIAVDSHNVGHIYAVVDNDGDGDVDATFMGTIDLADTPWIDLTPANFAG